jgi:hypothetical protein
LAGWQDSVQHPALLTPWSLMHFGSGCVASAVLRQVDPGIAFHHALTYWITLHMVYELKDVGLAALQLSLRGALAADDPTNNSPLNSGGDQVCSALGFVLAWVSRASVLESVIVLALMGVVLASSRMSADRRAISLTRIWADRG